MRSEKFSIYEGSQSSVNKKSRQAFKMVKSTFEPPQQTQASYQYLEDGRSYSQSLSLKGPKFSKKSIEDSHPIESNSYIPSLEIQNEQFHANIQFITSIRPIREQQHFEEGDCFPLDSDDRWLILSGEVKIIGINGLSFQRTAGFIFFASPQTKKRQQFAQLRIKEVIAVSSTTACRLPQQFFRDYIRNYLYVKNAEKIKYMKMSPFLVWNQSIAEDLAICMDLIDDIEKDSQIYKAGKEANHIYFIKQGIVLLERLGKAGNSVIQNYEKHYENTQLSDQEGLLIVRKGMIFGVDGILIKEKNDEINLLNNESPLENHHSEPNPQIIRPYEEKDEKPLKKLKTTRIYTAKSIGKCQLYRLDKVILETYFKMSEYLSEHPEQLHMSSQELDRICAEYTNLIMGSEKMNKVLRNKQFTFEQKIDAKEIQEFEKKKLRVKQIKDHEKKIKKITSNHPHDKSQEHEHPLTKDNDQYQTLSRSRQKIQPKQSISRKKQIMRKQVSLPSLKKVSTTNKRIEGLILKKLQEKQLQEYMTYKRRVEKSLLHHQQNQPVVPQAEKKKVSLQCIKVKSYRSILSSLG